MKLTPKLRKYLDKQFQYYCKKMKIKQPLVIYSDKELSGMVSSYKEYKSVKKHTLGESWHHKATKLDYDVVYMNVENTDYISQIIDTVVHELVHLKYPKLRHGSLFQKKINNIIISN